MLGINLMNPLIRHTLSHYSIYVDEYKTILAI